MNTIVLPYLVDMTNRKHSTESVALKAEEIVKKAGNDTEKIGKGVEKIPQKTGRGGKKITKDTEKIVKKASRKTVKVSENVAAPPLEAGLENLT